MISKFHQSSTPEFPPQINEVLIFIDLVIVCEVIMEQIMEPQVARHGLETDNKSSRCGFWSYELTFSCKIFSFINDFQM